MNRCEKCGRFVSVDAFKTEDGYVVCAACERDLHECSECGYFFFEDLNEGLCESCAEDFYHCTQCDSLFHRDDLQYTADDEGPYCESCFDEECRCCESCSEYYRWQDVYTTADGDFICEGCCSDHYAYCEGCGELFHVDYLYGGYCEDCEGGEYDSPFLGDYNDDPDPIFHGGDGLHLGVELEMDRKSSDHMRRREFGESLADAVGGYGVWSKYFWGKSDGSLSDHSGYELVTHPCTLEHHLTEVPWEALLNRAKSHGWRSHNMGNSHCGLHIHVDRSDFTAETELALAAFVYANKDRMERLARRTDVGYAKFKDVKEKVKGPNWDRYEAVNFTNRATIEFRLYRGTLNKNTLFATLELTDALSRYAARLTVVEGDDGSKAVHDLTGTAWNNFVEFVNAEGYSYLPRYLLDKDCGLAVTPSEPLDVVLVEPPRPLGPHGLWGVTVEATYYIGLRNIPTDTGHYTYYMGSEATGLGIHRTTPREYWCEDCQIWHEARSTYHRPEWLFRIGYVS